jgi:hypothetical protein
MAEWVKAEEFATQFEAELARARLTSAEIPCIIKSHSTGLFGPGYQGFIPGGVELHVPEPLLEEAREVLLPGDDDAMPDTDEEL